MSYQVLARKYRPRTFAELVGQEQVARALRHALDQNRLHHAYLFTGTRGVGKTTVARILARCLNCEKGVSASPCGECSACVAINEGRFFDLIEVDAASRTGIDDTRELLDNVQYAPSMGRFKVYLIDEVHMLSISSFNALLKTLEEPPPHVKFLLATTDPQKLPITVLSRCLQFNLKMLPADIIATHLAELLTQENVNFEPQALTLLGRAAAGSMRDALSLTDQAIAFGDGVLGESQVRAMLGSVDRDHVLKLLDALAIGKPAGLLQAMDEVFGYHPDALSLLDDLVSHFHQLAVEQIVPGRSDARLAELAQRFQAEQLQLYYDIAVRGRSGLAQLNDGKSGLEMLLLRMLLFRPEGVLVKAPLTSDDVASDAQPEGATAKKSQAATAAQPQSETPVEAVPVGAAVEAVAEAPTPAVDASAAVVAESPVAAELPAPVVPEPPAPVEMVLTELAVQETSSDYRAELESEEAAPPADTELQQTPAPATGKDDLDGWWMDLIPRLQLVGSTLQLAANSRLARRDSGHWQLLLAEGHRVWLTEDRVAEVTQGISAYFGRKVKLEWQLVDDVADTPAQRAERQRAINRESLRRVVIDDARTQALLNAFDGSLDEASIYPMIEEPHHGF